MTDYAEMRAALDAGPTPGPWQVQDDTDYPGGIDGPNDQNVLFGCGCCGSPNLGKKDAAHIAAANPKVIRALLAERDAFADALLAIEGMYEYDMPVGEAAMALYEASNIARAALAQGETNDR